MAKIFKFYPIRQDKGNLFQLRSKVLLIELAKVRQQIVGSTTQVIDFNKEKYKRNKLT